MSELTDYVIMPGSDYQNICNSVRSKTGGTDVLKSGEVSAAIDSIQASGGGIEHKDVNFYDYDGTLLHSYTVEEASSLTSLPTLPSHDGLICQGWNYDLDTIKEYNRPLNIGAMYITDDGKTRLYISIDIDLSSDITLNYGHTGTGITIDWGDGTTETVTDVGTISKTHTYTNSGDYIIKLSGSMSLGFDDGSTGLIYNMTKCNGYNTFNTLKKVEIGSDIRGIYKKTFANCYSLTNIVIPSSVSSINDYAFQNCYSLTDIVIPSSVSSIGKFAFNCCYSLTNIMIPSSVSSIGEYAFNACYSLTNIVIPSSVSIGDFVFQSCQSLTNIMIPSSVSSIGWFVFSGCYSLTNIMIPSSVSSIGRSAFNACYSLTNIVIPSSVSSINDYAFQNCYSLTDIVIPSSVSSINDYAFDACYRVRFYDFSSHTSVPSLGSNAFNNIPSDCEIRVPAALYDAWVAATNWSTYASNIVAV